MLQRHPLSAAFPDMEAKDFAELVEDIRANGLIQAVVTLDELVLDGWHRYRACLEAGAEPFFEAFQGDDPVAYVLSLNMHRRHLTGSQRAAAVVACSVWAPEGRPSKNPEPGSGLSTESEMAEAAGVSDKTIRQAKRAQEAGLGEAVRDGKVTAKRAAEVAKLPEPERKAALEAPPAPKPAPKVTTDVSVLTAGFGTPEVPAKDDRDARIAELIRDLAERDSKIADLQTKLEEAGAQVQELHEENESLHRILDGDDLLEGYRKEVKRVAELSRVTESRNRGLMVENHDLAGRLKSALKKLEKRDKPGAEKGEPEPAPMAPSEGDDYSATFGEEMSA